MTTSHARVLVRWLLAITLTAAVMVAGQAHAHAHASIPDTIYAAAERWGVDGNRMACIAWFESTWRPWVTSPGGDRGLFQFTDSTWIWASWNAGVGGSSPYDPYAAAESAAWLMSQGGWHHWSAVDWRCR